jgi:hypothetical protein
MAWGGRGCGELIGEQKRLTLLGFGGGVVGSCNWRNDTNSTIF